MPRFAVTCSTGAGEIGFYRRDRRILELAIGRSVSVFVAGHRHGHRKRTLNDREPATSPASLCRWYDKGMKSAAIPAYQSRSRQGGLGCQRLCAG